MGIYTGVNLILIFRIYNLLSNECEKYVLLILITAGIIYILVYKQTGKIF